jgi:endonuclease YncB( thermonuclease family)
MGLLSATGTINLAQFWPQGLSDADTVHVAVKEFRYSPGGSGPGKPTSVFRNAIVKGKGSKPAISKKGEITIRLQGIDATELHYRPTPLGGKGTAGQKTALKLVNKEYRQYLGETAANALGEKLRSLAKGKTVLPCTVTTLVDRPTDVFDTYGRFVGDIVIGSGSRGLNVNQWLVKSGWAFPTFYTSMTPTEIRTFVAAWKAGAKAKGGLGKYFSKKIAAFKPSLVLRRKGPLEPAKDRGTVNLPKLFRRQTTWWAYNQAGVTKLNFAAYIVEGKDEFLLTKDFFAHGIHAAQARMLGDYLKGGTFTLTPAEMVFKEKPSRLVTPAGKEIVSW